MEISNLHRQVGHTQARLGLGKAVSLAKTLSPLNPSVTIVPYEKVMDSTNYMGVNSKVRHSPGLYRQCGHQVPPE